MSKKDILKGIVKGTAPKSNFGTNPSDPWSTKHNISEDAMLNQYLLSRGMNPDHIPMATKVSHAKSSAFLAWKARHMREESELQEGGFKRIATDREEDERLGKMSALDKFRADSKAREKKHDDIEKQRQAQAKVGKTNVSGAIDRLEKSLNKEETEQIDELSKDTLTRYVKKATAQAKNSLYYARYGDPDDYSERETAGKNYDKRVKGIKAANARLKEESEHPELKAIRDKYEAYEGVGSFDKKTHEYSDDHRVWKRGNDLQKQYAQKKKELGISEDAKKVMSHAANLLKSIYKKKNIKEDLVDHEKEDKSVATYGKKPKHEKADPKDSIGEKKPNASAVLSGGTTLTGNERDTVEIDPMMRNRPGQPDITKKDDKKDDKKKDEKKKDK